MTAYPMLELYCYSIKMINKQGWVCKILAKQNEWLRTFIID